MAKASGKLRRRPSDVCRRRRGSDRANQNVHHSADSSNARQSWLECRAGDRWMFSTSLTIRARRRSRCGETDAFCAQGPFMNLTFISDRVSRRGCGHVSTEDTELGCNITGASQSLTFQVNLQLSIWSLVEIIGHRIDERNLCGAVVVGNDVERRIGRTSCGVSCFELNQDLWDGAEHQRLVYRCA